MIGSAVRPSSNPTPMKASLPPALQPPIIDKIFKASSEFINKIIKKSATSTVAIINPVIKIGFVFFNFTYNLVV